MLLCEAGIFIYIWDCLGFIVNNTLIYSFLVIGLLFVFLKMRLIHTLMGLASGASLIWPNESLNIPKKSRRTRWGLWSTEEWGVRSEERDLIERDSTMRSISLSGTFPVWPSSSPLRWRVGWRTEGWIEIAPINTFRRLSIHRRIRYIKKYFFIGRWKWKIVIKIILLPNVKNLKSQFEKDYMIVVFIFFFASKMLFIYWLTWLCSLMCIWFNFFFF